MSNWSRSIAIVVALGLITGCAPAAPAPTAPPKPTAAPAASPKPAAPASPAPAAKPAAAASPAPAASPAASPAAASPAAAPAAKAPEAPVSFKFRTPFVPALAYASFYVAKELYWPGLNLNVDVLPGTGSSAAVQTVAAGSEQMGYSALSSVLTAISQGAPVTIIGVVQRRDPAGLTFLTETGIRTLKDVEGKIVGDFPGGTAGALVRLALQRAGVDESSIRFVNVNPGGEVTLLMQKQIQAMAGFAGSQDVRISCQGVPAGAIPVSDFGIDIYGQAVIANTNWVREVGDEVVTRSLLGIIQAARVVKAETGRAVDILTKLNPQRPLDRVQELASASNKGFVRLSEDTGSEVLKQHGYGWLDQAEMDRTQDLLLEAGIIQSRTDPARLYTTKYLEDPRVKAAAMSWLGATWQELPADVKQQCGL
jgi:NitT/TauT family transport system substrate-binding protein